jgi:membrane protein insertase Oxa1/YidC/SpoIIIJ
MQLVNSHTPIGARCSQQHRHGSSQLAGRRCAPLLSPARLAQHQQQRTGSTQLRALPVNELAHDLHTHAAAVYDLADAAAAAAGSSASSSSGGFLSPLTDTLETVLKTIQSQLNRLHVPYSYGWSIICLTLVVKLVTLPLTKIQVCCRQQQQSAQGEHPGVVHS